MRLSFTKTIVLSVIVVVLSALAMALWCMALPAQSAAADSDIDLQISGISSKMNKQYGDLFDNAVDAEGRIYGKIENYIFKAGEGTEYYILAKDFKVSQFSGNYTSSTKQLCNDKGLVWVDVLADYNPADTSTGKYYLTYDDTESGYFTFFEKLQVYVAETDEPFLNYKVTYNRVNELIFCQVVPREITVAYNAEASHVGGGLSGSALPTEEKGGVLYVNHIYGSLPDTIAFAEQDSSAKVMTVFGDALTTSTTFEGNDLTTHVGLYEIQSLDLHVSRAEADVSRNYRFSSALEHTDLNNVTFTGYGVQVVPRTLEIGTFCRESTFAAKRDTYEGLFNGTAVVEGTFTSQGFAKAVADTGVSNQTVVVYYDVVLGQEGLWDKDALGVDREGIVAITEGESQWALGIVGWRVSCTDANYQASGADYVVLPALGAAHTIKVGKRSIVLYEHTSGMGEKPDNWVDVIANHIAISLPYGYAYTGEREHHEITIDNIPVTLSFELQYEAGVSLAAYLASHEMSEIILHAGTYDIINPEVTDVHYNVTVDESVRWTVTKKTVDYAQLVSWGIGDDCYVADATGDKAPKAMYAYLAAYAASTQGICLREYAFDADRTDLALTYSFVDKDIDANVNIEVDLAVAAHAPGYYASSFAHADYEIAEGVLYVRILPVEITLTMPTAAVYRGASFAVIPHFDGQDANPFGDWPVTLTYKMGNRTANPINAGTYKVVVDIGVPDGMSANPYLIYEKSGESFTIAPKPIVVRLKSTAQLTKTFGDSVSKRKLTFDADNLVGADSISLDSEGLADDSAPGTYPITISLDKGESVNYTLTLKDSADRSNPVFTVEKISAASVIDYFDELLQGSNIAVTTDRITLAGITYYGTEIDGVAYQYSVGEGMWIATSTSVIGLKEGTKYRVRIGIFTDSRYIDATENMFTSPRVVITDIIRPTIEQDVLATTGRSVKVNITNFDSSKTYAVAAYDDGVATVPQNVTVKALGTPDEEGAYVIASAFSVIENADEVLLDQLDRMTNGTAYRVVVVCKTTDYAVCSEPLTVHTRSSAPNLTASAFTVSDNAITVPEGYYIYVAEIEDTGALPVSSVVETSMQKVGVTYAMLAESGAALTDEYVQSVASGLEPNKTYVVAIWQQAEDAPLPGDVQCFTFRTLIDKNNRFSYTGAMLLVSRYLLVGLTGLVLLLFIICTIRYAALKKKLSGGNR